MSDIERIKARAMAARQFTVACGSRTYVLQLPTPHELEVAAAKRSEGDLGMVEFFRAQLERAMVGWQGVRECDFAPGTELPIIGQTIEPPVAFSAELVPWLLDAQPADAEQLRTALIDALAKRRERIEAAAKN